MSADNGVYLKQFSDGWRVAEFTNVEELDSYGLPGSEGWKVIHAYMFRDTVAFQDYKAALAHAAKLASECAVLEYGICELDPSDQPFPVFYDDYVDGFLSGYYQGMNHVHFPAPPNGEPCF